jgi:AraC-like DNA-binding protein
MKVSLLACARSNTPYRQLAEHPIAIDDIADAAYTSRRTLHRAFSHVLDETPQSRALRRPAAKPDAAQPAPAPH